MRKQQVIGLMCDAKDCYEEARGKLQLAQRILEGRSDESLEGVAAIITGALRELDRLPEILARFGDDYLKAE